MWQCILICYSIVQHCLCFTVVLTQILLICCKRREKESAEPSHMPLPPDASKTQESGTPSDGTKESATKLSKEAPTQLGTDTTKSKETITVKTEEGYDVNKIKHFVEERRKDSTKTDLRSVQDLVFQYNPKHPLGSLPPPSSPKGSQKVKELALERTQVTSLEKEDDRELSVIVPTTSFLGPPSAKGSLPTLSVYDPLGLIPPHPSQPPPVPSPVSPPPALPSLTGVPDKEKTKSQQPSLSTPPTQAPNKETASKSSQISLSPMPNSQVHSKPMDKGAASTPASLSIKPTPPATPQPRARLTPNTSTEKQPPNDAEPAKK
ncbi:unnamed protein product [Cylicocyclus nassatus]|uniref:Uncharacterized protein n=1 Tax=Cylicocyclus nassatus TaxID=53992 RepID=A0AA36M1N3_CYLNA|nr:unnamed protein product [Cylicocyclus nassatus]